MALIRVFSGTMQSTQIVGHAGLGSGAYTLYEASRIIRVPYQKLRRWASGYWYVDEDRVEHFSTAVVSESENEETDERVLSFYELMELFVVGFYRTEGVSMSIVRAARANAQKLFDTEFPFATQRLPTDGKRIFADLSASALDMSGLRLTIELSKGQVALDDVVRPFFRELDFDKGLAFRYWPMGREQPVVLDARRSFGKPIVESSGVPTFALFNMIEGGEDRRTVAQWYEIELKEVDAAIKFEQQLRAA